MKVFLWIAYIFFFLKELFKSSFSVALAVLSPRKRVQPAFVRIPLDLKTDLGITILANTITLTPGTLSIDVSKDKKFLFIHALYVDRLNIPEFRQEVKDVFEKKVIRLVES